MSRVSDGMKGFCYGTRLHGVKTLTTFSPRVLLSTPSLKDIAQIFYFVRWAKFTPFVKVTGILVVEPTT